MATSDSRFSSNRIAMNLFLTLLMYATVSLSLASFNANLSISYFLSLCLYLFCFIRTAFMAVNWISIAITVSFSFFLSPSIRSTPFPFVPHVSAHNSDESSFTYIYTSIPGFWPCANYAPTVCVSHTLNTNCFVWYLFILFSLYFHFVHRFEFTALTIIRDNNNNIDDDDDNGDTFFTHFISFRTLVRFLSQNEWSCFQCEHSYETNSVSLYIHWQLLFTFKNRPIISLSINTVSTDKSKTSNSVVERYIFLHLHFRNSIVSKSTRECALKLCRSGSHSNYQNASRL